jgi:Mn2+/Fe2+ NRAMP family transporter
MVIGVAGALVPGIPVIALLLGTQVLNGLLLPVVLAFIAILSAQRRLMANLRPGRVSTGVTWLTLVLVALAAAAFVLNLGASV